VGRHRSAVWEGQTVRAYITGHGSIARRHADNLLALAPDAEILLQHTDRPLSGALSRASIVRSATDAIEQGIDAAIVASATAAHPTALMPLVQAGVPMYVEKPVVADRESLDFLSASIAEHAYDAPTIVGCNLRFLPSLQALRSDLISGRIGRVVRGLFEAGQWLPDWRPDRDYRTGYSAHADQGGGVILDLVHEIDAARWLLGEFQTVTSDFGHRSSLDLHSEDTAGILMSRPSGPLAIISLDYVSRRPVRRYSIVGEEGTLVWSLQEKSLALHSPAGVEHIDLPDGSYDVSSTYVVAMSEFLKAVHDHKQTSQPLSEGIRSMDLALRSKGL